MKKKTPSSSIKIHYKNDQFLKALGNHCQRLRTQKGYSIDRMSKEAENLSSSVIHRLESGSGAVTVSALYRYARILGLHMRGLFEFQIPEQEIDFEEKGQALPRLKIYSKKDALVKKGAFKNFLPLYTLKAAAGYFGEGEAVEVEGWVKIPNMSSLPKLSEDMFVVQAVGKSMLPKIKDKDYLVFKANPVGTRQGKIVLIQYRGPADPETGGAYTVKVYSSAKIHHRDESWRHKQITLTPLNPDFEPIVLSPKDEKEVKLLGEYLFTL